MSWYYAEWLEELVSSAVSEQNEDPRFHFLNWLKLKVLNILVQYVFLLRWNWGLEMLSFRQIGCHCHSSKEASF